MAVNSELAATRLSQEADYQADNYSFFEANRQSLDVLFGIMGIKRPLDLDEAISLTQPWTRGDHFNPLAAPDIPKEQLENARLIYESLGLTNEKHLPAGTYDQIIVLGALQRANNARLGFLSEAFKNGVELADDGRVVMWGGPRQVVPEKEAAIIKTQLEAGRTSSDPWLQAVSRGELPVNNETDELRLAASSVFGVLRTKQVHFRLNDGQYPIERYSFMSEVGGIDLLDAQPVTRPNGESRHTTQSCAIEWLDRLSPKSMAKVGFISNNPHIIRTARDVQSVLVQEGRSDIELVAAGPAAYNDAPDYLFLGEIARNLYGDLNQ